MYAVSGFALSKYDNINTKIGRATKLLEVLDIYFVYLLYIPLFYLQLVFTALKSPSFLMFFRAIMIVMREEEKSFIYPASEFLWCCVSASLILLTESI